jgi:hypothetical protein
VFPARIGNDHLNTALARTRYVHVSDMVSPLADSALALGLIRVKYPFGDTISDRWIVGLIVSLGLGWLVVELFRLVLSPWTGDKPDKKDRPYVPPSATGLVERLFFTTLYGLLTDPSGVPTVMFTWLAAKLAANWGHISKANDPIVTTFTIRALLLGLLSMLAALIGGVIVRGQH